MATNLPDGIYVETQDEMRARQVLDLVPAEIAERDLTQTQHIYNLRTATVIMLIITAVALLCGTMEIVTNRAIH